MARRPTTDKTDTSTGAAAPDPNPATLQDEDNAPASTQFNDQKVRVRSARGRVARETVTLHAEGNRDSDGGQPAVDAADASSNDEEPVRRRAYQLWEEAGRPEGDHERHWHEARRLIEEEDQGR